MRNPLKQGLKHFVIGFCRYINCMVAMRNPLKQGLKQIYRQTTNIYRIGRNAKSTKTRIETAAQPPAWV